MSISASPLSGRAPLTVDFAVVISGSPGIAYACQWFFGDGNYTTLPTFLGDNGCAALTHVYTSAGEDQAVLAFFPYDSNASCGPGWGCLPPLWAHQNISVQPSAYSALWTNASGNVAPSPRAGAAMAWDPALNEDVLFGGSGPGGAGGCQFCDDTWTFRGGVWTNVTSRVAGAPSPRYGSIITYDPGTGGLVLVGGFTATSGGNFLNDSWNFTGTAWTPLPTFPQDLAGNNELAYDATDHYLALTGYFVVPPQGDTEGVWSYDASGWHLVTNEDPALQWDPMTYDSTDGYILGLGGNGSYHSFEYLAGTWTALSPTVEPPWGEWQTLVDDPSIGGVLLPYSAAWDYPDCHPVGNCFQTWAYVGGDWTNLTGLSPLLPDQRNGAAEAYDGADGSAVLFGGVDGSNYLNDTWEFAESTANLFSVTVTSSATTGPSPLTADFSSQISGGTAPYTYDWRSDDGTYMGSGSTVAHTFVKGGVYGVTLDVVDARGQVASYVVTENVSIGVPLSATYLIHNMSGPAPLHATFQATASGGWYGTDSFSWAFGDGTSAEGARASHAYDISGVFYGQLTVNDSLGEFFVGQVADYATYTFTITVGSPSVPAPLTVVATCAPTSGVAPLTVSFSGAAGGGVGPYRLLWSFGDGSPGSTYANPTHIYNASGSFTVELTVVDAQGGTNSTYLHLNVSFSSGGTSQGTLEEELLGVVGVVAVLSLAVVLIYRERLSSSRDRSKAPPRPTPPESAKPGSDPPPSPPSS